jgi:DNA-binding NtrC family response regulator
VIVVEDDAVLRRAIARIMLDRGAQVSEAGSAAEAKSLLSQTPPPDLLVIDVHLPDETVFEVLELATRNSPAPIVVAMSGKASPEEAFRLAQVGVRAYLAKPFAVRDLESAVETALHEPPSLDPLIPGCVGHVPMRELQRQVRSAMVKEALARTDGSRSGAARLLDVSRQAIQQILRGRRARAKPDRPSERRGAAEAPSPRPPPGPSGPAS